MVFWITVVIRCYPILSVVCGSDLHLLGTKIPIIRPVHFAGGDHESLNAFKKFFDLRSFKIINDTDINY